MSETNRIAGTNFFDSILYDVMLSYLHTPYLWGGENPNAGFDCSGFVIDVLQSAGVLSHKFDTSAQGLYNLLLSDAKQSVRGLGSVVFYGRGWKKISHVEIMIDQYRVIGANGGDSTTITIDEAIRRDARIRIRPLDYRKDRLMILRPSYYKIGEM